MKTFCISFVFVCLFAVSSLAQDCADGTCSYQRSTPVVDAVANTAQTAVTVATAPVRFVATNKPVRRVAKSVCGRVRAFAHRRCR